MKTFEFAVSEKEFNGAKGITRVNKFILRLLAKRMKEQKITRKELAARLQLDKSTVSRMLRGNQNLTSRTIGEICGALDFEFDLVERDLLYEGRNHTGKAPKIVSSMNSDVLPATRSSGLLVYSNATRGAAHQ